MKKMQHLCNYLTDFDEIYFAAPCSNETNYQQMATANLLACEKMLQLLQRFSFKVCS